jgi:hypothetical protein
MQEPHLCAPELSRLQTLGRLDGRL